MKEFLTLIRWKNLLIVTITMVLMRYFVIAPLLSQMSVILVSEPDTAAQMMLRLPWYEFIMLVFATVCLTAAGYVINDYFDIKTDLINRGKVIVGAGVSRRKAMMWHSIFNIAGVAAGFYISWKAGYFWLGILFLIVSGLLYFYSASYKRQFLIGNIIVALLTAMVPMLVVIFEWPPLYRYYTANAVTPPQIGIIFYWVGGFAIFAFLITLVREIIKDIEDFEGDVAYGRNTVPVVTGIMTARIISIFLILVTAGLLYGVWYFFLNDKITLIYISLAIVLPLLFVVYQLIIGTTKKQLHYSSRIIKFVMIAGVLYSVVVKVILDQNLV